MNESAPNPGEKKKKKEKKTFRCKLPLSKDKDKYAEISWYDLLAKQHKHSSEDTSTEQEKDKPTVLDPFASDDEDQLQALAAKFDKKYAEKPKKRAPKRRMNIEDLAEGYDQNDPFIDDSECFDEDVPQELTTAHGGFYVNSGVLEFKNNSQAVFEISDSDEGSDPEGGGGGGKPKVKKEKKSVPVGGIPIVPAKKAKVKNTKARIITTPINSGPKNQTNKQNNQKDNSAKQNKIKPQKEIKILTIIDSPEREDKSTGGSSTKKIDKVPSTNSTNSSIIKANTGKKKVEIVTLSSSPSKPTTKLKPESSTNSSPIIITSIKSGNKTGVTASPATVTSAKSAASPALKVTSITTSLTTPKSSVTVTASSTSKTSISSSSPSLAKPSLGSSSDGGSSSSNSTDRKDLKAERKVKSSNPGGGSGAGSKPGQVGQSSPKPPELVDLEAQLNDLANACDKSKTSGKGVNVDKVRQNLSNALSVSKSSSPKPSNSSSSGSSTTTTAKNPTAVDYSKPVSGAAASTQFNNSSVKSSSSANNSKFNQSISITKISSSPGEAKIINSSSSSQKDSKHTYSWTKEHEKTSPVSLSSSTFPSPKTSSPSSHSVATLAKSSVMPSTGAATNSSSKYNVSRPQNNAKETSPTVVTSGGNQFIQSQSSHNQFNQSQTGGTQFNQSSPRSIGTGANVIGHANNGSRTYNTTSGNVAQLNSTSVGYSSSKPIAAAPSVGYSSSKPVVAVPSVGYPSSKPVAAIPGIRQTTISPQTMNQGTNQNHTLSGSKKSQQFGREAIKQLASTTPTSQNHIAKVISPGAAGGINVKSIYSTPHQQANQHHHQISPSSQHHHQAQSVQQSSPRGIVVQQQTSPRGFVSQQASSNGIVTHQSSSPMGIINQQTSPRGVVNQQTSPRGVMGNSLQQHHQVQQGSIVGMSSAGQQPATSIYQMTMAQKDQILLQQQQQQQHFNQMNPNLMSQMGVGVNSDLSTQMAYQPEVVSIGKIKNKAKNSKKAPLTESNKAEQSGKTKKHKNDTKANKVTKALKKTKDGAVKKAKLKENVKIPVPKEKIKKIVAKENKKSAKTTTLIDEIKNNKKATEKTITPKTGEIMTINAEKIVKKTPKTKENNETSKTLENNKKPKSKQTIKKVNKAKTAKAEVTVKNIKKADENAKTSNLEKIVKNAPKVKESFPATESKEKKKPIKKSKVNVSPEKEAKFKCFYCQEVPKKPSRSELYRHYAIKHHKKDLILHFETTYGPIAKGGKDLPCPVCKPQVIKNNRASLIDHMALKHNLVEQFLPESAKIV